MANNMNDPRWQKMRLKIMERDNWTCVACGRANVSLNVHHIEYCGELWDSKPEDLQTLCDRCHSQLGKHPKGGPYYLRVFGCEMGDIHVAFKHCPICGCKKHDCHSGCVIFTCGCIHLDIPEWLKMSFHFQGETKSGDPSYVCYDPKGDA